AASAFPSTFPCARSRTDLFGRTGFSLFGFRRIGTRARQAEQLAKKVIYFVIPKSPRRLRSLSLVQTQEKRDSSARSAPRNDKNLSFSVSREASPTCGFANIGGIGYEIHAARGKGMAARDAAQREPRTTPRAVDAHGLGGVMRAGRIKLAGARHQRRKKSLIHSHGKEQGARREAHVFGPVFRIPRSRRTSSASSGANAACA